MWNFTPSGDGKEFLIKHAAQPHVCTTNSLQDAAAVVHYLNGGSNISAQSRAQDIFEIIDEINEEPIVEEVH